MNNNNNNKINSISITITDSGDEQVKLVTTIDPPNISVQELDNINQPCVDFTVMLLTMISELHEFGQPKAQPVH